MKKSMDNKVFAKIILHTLGLTTLMAATYMTFLMLFSIWRFGYFIAWEPSQTLIAVETFIGAGSFVYVAFLVGKLVVVAKKSLKVSP
jgi:hypothetical protein